MTDSGVKLCPIFGGTEFGAPTYLKRRPGGYGDWEWITMDDRVKIRWDPQGDGTYECQFLVRLAGCSRSLSKVNHLLRPLRTINYQSRICLTQKDTPPPIFLCPILPSLTFGKCEWLCMVSRWKILMKFAALAERMMLSYTLLARKLYQHPWRTSY